jgi:hypothetical protein
VLALALAGTGWVVYGQKRRPASTFPGLTLKWPGPPSENIQATPGGGLEPTYAATYVSRSPGRFLLFSAGVTDFGPKVAEEMSPEDLLAASVTAFQKDEVSRTPIEHGPRRHPGFDIVSRRDGKVTRKVVVVAGSRVFTVSVTTSKEELLEDLEVKAFFQSFAVER